MRPENAATLVAPVSGSTLSIAAPPLFAVQPPVTSARNQVAPVAPAPDVGNGGTVPSRRSLLRRALDWLSPVATAHAHCLPVSGDNFLLRLTRDGDRQAAYSALTSVTDFTPTAATWAKALQGRAGQTLRLTLIRAFYSGGAITDGPFVGNQVASFVVAP